MNILPRKVKAALGIGSIWGAVFAGVGAVLGGLLPTTTFLSTATGLAAVAGGGGLLLGIGFAGLLSAMEGRRTLDELTSRRAALWGFLAGSALAGVGSLALGTLLDVVNSAEAVLGLGVPAALQIAAVLTGAVSYGAIAAGLASATISVAKRSDPAEGLVGGASKPERLSGDASSPESPTLGSTT